MQKPCPDAGELARWLAALPSDGMASVGAHVESCPACQSAVENLLGPPPEARTGPRPTGGPEEAAFLRRLAMQEPNTLPLSPAAPLGGPAVPASAPPGY